jgi:hypothetical protein
MTIKDQKAIAWLNKKLTFHIEVFKERRADWPEDSEMWRSLTAVMQILDNLRMEINKEIEE